MIKILYDDKNVLCIHSLQKIKTCSYKETSPNQKHVVVSLHSESSKALYWCEHFRRLCLILKSWNFLHSLSVLFQALCVQAHTCLCFSLMSTLPYLSYILAMWHKCFFLCIALWVLVSGPLSLPWCPFLPTWWNHYSRAGWCAFFTFPPWLSGLDSIGHASTLLEPLWWHLAHCLTGDWLYFFCLFNEVIHSLKMKPI